MGLRLLIGPSGSGKTTICQKELALKQQEDTGIRYFYLVPEQYSLEAEKELLMHTACNGILNAEVITFRRLAFRMFAKKGIGNRVVLTDAGKTMVLRKVIHYKQGELCYFSRSIDKQGFVGKLCDTISEFFAYGVTPFFLQELYERTPDSAIKYKLSDLSLLYGEYVAFLEQSYLTAEETLSLLAEKSFSESLLSGAEIWIDGFYGFTPQEFRILEKILCAAKAVTVTFAMDRRSFYQKGLKVWDGFFEPAETARKLLYLAEKNGVRIEKPVFLEESRRFQTPSLVHLERGFFYQHAVKKQEAEGVMIYCAANKYGEIYHVAGTILSLLQKKQYRFRDIAVVTAALPSYQKVITGIFQEYSIPYFMDQKQEVISHPLMELIKSCLDIFVWDFSYESIFRYLKTGLVNVTRQEIDCLENYVLAYGIRGYKWKLEAWDFGFKAHPDPEKQAALLSTRAKILEPLLRFGTDFTTKEVYPVRKITLRLYQLLIEIGVPDRIMEWIADREQEKDLSRAFVHKQCYQILMEVLDKLVEILGEEEVTLEEYGKILTAGLSASDLGMIPPEVDRVIIGDLERTRLPKIKALFVIGVNDGVLPSPTASSGLFSELEREQLQAAGAELAHNGKRRAFEEQYLIYLGLTKAEERLYFSYPISDLNGKSLKPSVLLHKIKSIFPTLAEERETPESLQRDQQYAAGVIFHQLGWILRAKQEGQPLGLMWQAMYVYFENHPDWQEKVKRMLTIAEEKQGKENLTQESLDQLFQGELRTSVSRLERYAACPYAYFLQYGLQVKERPSFKLRAPDLGTLFHSVLEIFSKTVAERQLTFSELTQKEAEQMAIDAVEQAAPTLANEVLQSTAAYQYLIGRLKRIAQRAVWTLVQHSRRGSFQPKGFEVGFGRRGELPAITIFLSNGEKMILDGKIDRVDVYDANGKRYIKIIDYKSGVKTFRLQDVYYGLQLQLLLYLGAFMEQKEEGRVNLPGGIFYFKVTDPMLTAAKEMSAAEIEEMLFKELKLSGLVLAEEEVVKALDHKFAGENGSLRPRMSDVIPVGITAAGGFRKDAAIATREEYEILEDLAKKRARETGDKMRAGKIAIMPYRYKKITPCTYCQFRSICLFDPVEMGYRQLKDFPKEELWRRIHKATEEQLQEENGL